MSQETEPVLVACLMYWGMFYSQSLFAFSL